MQRNMRCKNVFIMLDGRFTLHKLFLLIHHNKQYDFWKLLRIGVPIFEWRRFERILDHHNRYLFDVKRSYLIIQCKKCRINVLSCIALQHIHNIHQTEKRWNRSILIFLTTLKIILAPFYTWKCTNIFINHIMFDSNILIWIAVFNNNEFNVFRHNVQPILWLSLCER